MKPGCHRIPGVRDSKTLSMAPARTARTAHPQACRRGRRRGRFGPRDRPAQHLSRHAPRDAAGDRPARRPRARLVDGNRIVGFEAQVGPYTNDRRRRRARCYSIACASIVAKVVRDRMMTTPRGALSGLRLGAQPGLRDARPPRCDPGARADAVPPAVVPRAPADARRRPARLRPARRPGGLAGDCHELLERELVPVDGRRCRTRCRATCSPSRRRRPDGPGRVAR